MNGNRTRPLRIDTSHLKSADGRSWRMLRTKAMVWMVLPRPISSARMTLVLDHQLLDRHHTERIVSLKVQTKVKRRHVDYHVRYHA